MLSPGWSHGAPGLARSSSAWRGVCSPQWAAGSGGSRGAEDQACSLRDLWGLGVWHVQWLVSGPCPQVTWGGTRQAGPYPRALPSLACDADCEQ